LVRFDLLSGRLYVEQSELRLTPLELRFVAFLGLDSSGASREELADTFFATSQDARNAIKVLVYRIREKVGRHSVIRYSDGRYALDHDPVAELREIEREFLPSDGSTALDEITRRRFASYLKRLRARNREALLDQPWFDRVEWRLRQLEHGLCIHLSRDALSRADGRGALENISGLIDSAALDEDAIEVYMRAQVILGNPSAALAQFERYAEALRSELDAKPSQALSRLADTVKASLV